jgi:hypothetical protein
MAVVAEKVEFRNYRCFKAQWAGFSEIRPINVIIGRNNTGKSHLLDLVAALCRSTLKSRGWQLRMSGRLDEQTLKQTFQSGTTGQNGWTPARFTLGKPRPLFRQCRCHLDDKRAPRSDGRQLQ